jgi:hypothetical protein
MGLQFSTETYLVNKTKPLLDLRKVNSCSDQQPSCLQGTTNPSFFQYSSSIPRHGHILLNMKLNIVNRPGHPIWVEVRCRLRRHHLTRHTRSLICHRSLHIIQGRFEIVEWMAKDLKICGIRPVHRTTLTIKLSRIGDLSRKANRSILSVM